MASNPYVNKVQLADGTTVIDISDTTAVASDVASGKFFYTAAGQKVQGSASGGGGGAGSVTQDQDGYLVLDDDAPTPSAGAVVVTESPDIGGGVIKDITAVDISDTTATAADVAVGKYFYTASGVKTAGTAGSIDIFDFSGGNILSLISHGTEYILTDYYDLQTNLYTCKIKDTTNVAWEGYWSARGANKVTCLERYNTNWILQHFIQSGTLNYSPSGYASGTTTPFIDALSCFGYPEQPLATTVPFSILCIMRADGTVANEAACEFYGLNIIDSDMRYVKRFVPWLENGTACIKELVSGTIYYNSGTGGFDYTDTNGVVHYA